MRRTALVAVAAALGAGLRWATGAAIGQELGRFPWATLTVNVVGCLAIGVAARRLDRDSDAWCAIVVGLLGGLTTFSAFAVEVEQLVAVDRTGQAVAYVVASLATGVAATAVALRGAGGEGSTP